MNEKKSGELPSNVAQACERLQPLIEQFADYGFHLDPDYDVNRALAPAVQPLRLARRRDKTNHYVAPRMPEFGEFGLQITLGYGSVPPFWPFYSVTRLADSDVRKLSNFNWREAVQTDAIPHSSGPEHVGEHGQLEAAFQLALAWFSSVGDEWLHDPLSMTDEEWLQRGLQVRHSDSTWLG